MISRPIAVLVVDDEPLIRLSLVDALEDEGFKVFEAPNADIAIAIIEANSDIRLVFTDIDMPGSMDGLKLAAFVRNRWPPIKIIVTSGRMVPSDEDLPQGVPFLPKPYEFNRIAEAMRAAMTG